ncbi:MAG: DegT/DnrJ/EryC1/StrS aminotransferase family protein [Candidatus Latescibacteria bacterium]|nr:DegT/DnrJ/EryC1/StrS aminotransferase family protein [Candidatus Latescibacterota bacterium]
MLAIDGGPKVRETPFPKRYLFGDEERQVALRLFSEAQESGNAIGYSGPEELSYEREFAAFMGGGYADLVNSGTSALYAALGALKLEAAGEVVIPPITDPGGAMPAALLCQVPVVADAAPGSFNAGAEQIAAVLTPHTHCRRTSGYDADFGAGRGARHTGHRGLRPGPRGAL